MTIVLAIIAALFGGVAGAALGFFAVIALGTLTGADTQQGALAMGAATTGLPIGAVVGAVLAAVLVVHLRRGRAAEPATSQAAAGGRATPEAGDAADRPTARQGIGWQGWTALVLVVAAAGAFWTWLNWSGDPWRFRGSSRPVLFSEIRVPAGDPGIAWAMERGPDLRNGQVYHGMDGRMQRRDEGEHTILSARHVIAYKTEDRSVELWLGQERLLIFDLDLARTPDERPEFSDWRRVDHVRADFYGEDFPAEEHDYHIRTKVLWGGS